MPVFRVQARLPRKGGLAEDDVVNVWHFDSDQSMAEDLDDVVGRVGGFYATIQAMLSDRLTGVVNLKGWQLPDPALPAAPADYNVGAPDHVATANFVPQAMQPLASELAICVTLIADSPASMDVRYRRGRLYIGPLNSSTTAYQPADSDVRIDQEEINVLGNAMANLAIGPDLGDGRLCVYSPTYHRGRGPTTGGAPGGRGPLPALPAHSLDEATNDVDRILIDNAFDIQRRRGSGRTSRTTFIPV